VIGFGLRHRIQRHPVETREADGVQYRTVCRFEPPPMSCNRGVVHQWRKLPQTQLSHLTLLTYLTFLAFPLAAAPRMAPNEVLFSLGSNAYRAGDYGFAVYGFEQSAALVPSSGTLQNLGLAEWQRGRPGEAILAWERALWLDPFNQPAKTNLRFARKVAQIEAPDLTWYEVVSTWLPGNWWAWIAGFSLWLAVAAAMLPGILRFPRAAWHQAVAALGLTVFLLSLPAHLGVLTRSHIGFVIPKATPLRLTPTSEAQVLTRLGAGEPARVEKRRGSFVLVKTSHGTGWVETQEFGLISP
jgi:hypothetical protein